MSLALATIFLWTHGRNVHGKLGRNKLYAASATRRSQHHENNKLGQLSTNLVKLSQLLPLKESSLEEPSLEESSASSAPEPEEETRSGWSDVGTSNHHVSKTLWSIDFRRMGLEPIAPCCHLVTKPKTLDARSVRRAMVV